MQMKFGARVEKRVHLKEIKENKTNEICEMNSNA
jgi:hypothetical protein